MGDIYLQKAISARLQCYVNSTTCLLMDMAGLWKICLSVEISARRFVPSVVLFVQPTEKKRTSNMNMLSDNFPRIFTFDMNPDIVLSLFIYHSMFYHTYPLKGRKH